MPLYGHFCNICESMFTVLNSLLYKISLVALNPAKIQVKNMHIFCVFFSNFRVSCVSHNVLVHRLSIAAVHHMCVWHVPRRNTVLNSLP